MEVNVHLVDFLQWKSGRAWLHVYLRSKQHKILCNYQACLCSCQPSMLTGPLTRTRRSTLGIDNSFVQLATAQLCFQQHTSAWVCLDCYLAETCHILGGMLFKVVPCISCHTCGVYVWRAHVHSTSNGKRINASLTIYMGTRSSRQQRMHIELSWGEWSLFLCALPITRQ